MCSGLRVIGLMDNELTRKRMSFFQNFMGFSIGISQRQNEDWGWLGVGEGGWGVIVKGYGVFFWGNQNVLELVSGGGCVMF